ncbi:MAG TPA: DUF535 family protein, partial [Methylophilaceae bacterium]|nr:DUF535 family protein [Methylophilaceae bacterium]
KFSYLANKHQVEIENLYTRLNVLNVTVTPEMLGVIEWPYIHNQWDVKTKLDKIATHYEIISKSYPHLMQIRTTPIIKICDFDTVSKGVFVGIDYAKWFTREGELVINIFRDDLRVASIAFTIGLHLDKVVAYVGAVQGIHGGIPADESLEIFKILTKDFAGLRPRSLLLEALKVVARQLGAIKILGISEENRHHRHAYFGNDQKTVFQNDYNLFWEEHDGKLIDDIGFYELDLAPAIRDLSIIASKKRSQYRRRNELLADINNTINLQ